MSSLIIKVISILFFKGELGSLVIKDYFLYIFILLIEETVIFIYILTKYIIIEYEGGKRIIIKLKDKYIKSKLYIKTLYISITTNIVLYRAIDINK